MISCDTIKKFEDVCLGRHDAETHNRQSLSSVAFWAGAAYGARTCLRIETGSSIEMAELSDMEPERMNK